MKKLSLIFSLLAIASMVAGCAQATPHNPDAQFTTCLGANRYTDSCNDRHPGTGRHPYPGRN